MDDDIRVPATSQDDVYFGLFTSPLGFCSGATGESPLHDLFS